jgi:DNA-binding SARP family transcriptional activator
MELSLSFGQETLTVASEASSLAILLERGIHCTRQGNYVEGTTYFARAREQLSPGQMHFAAGLDAFIQSHARYLQAQQALHMASKRFVEADSEQQAHLIALEKLLLALREDTDRAPPSPQLSSTDSTTELPSPLPHSSRKDCDALPALYFTCFGRFEVRQLGKPIALCSSRSGRSILRYLVAQPGHCATIDTLMALLWPEDEPEIAQPKLHSAISVLRRSLNHGYSCDPGCGYIVCKNRVYHLNPSVVIRTDVDEFLQCYQAEERTSEERVALYEKACHLYTGPFLPEDVYADWSFLQREYLNQTYLAMCRVLADHYLKTQSYEAAAKWATTILKVNRCDEGAHQQLIQVYAAQGRRSEVLQQYQRCESILREELGVPPLPETTLVFQMAFTNGPSPADTAKIQLKYSPS